MSASVEAAKASHKESGNPDEQLPEALTQRDRHKPSIDRRKRPESDAPENGPSFEQ